MSVDLSQLGRFQKGAAERLVIAAAVSSLGALALKQRQDLANETPELADIYDQLLQCLEILNNEKGTS